MSHHIYLPGSIQESRHRLIHNTVTYLYLSGIGKKQLRQLGFKENHIRKAIMDKENVYRIIREIERQFLLLSVLSKLYTGEKALFPIPSLYLLFDQFQPFVASSAREIPSLLPVYYPEICDGEDFKEEVKEKVRQLIKLRRMRRKYKKQYAAKKPKKRRMRRKCIPLGTA